MGIRPNTTIIAATVDDDRMRLVTDHGDTLIADRVILATGYRTDVRSIRLLAPSLLDRLAIEDGYPKLGTDFQTTVPGLFVTWALAGAEQALPAVPEPVLALTPQIPRLFDECAAWDVGRAAPVVHDPVRSDVPVLLLSGTFDAITSRSWAEIAARGLSHGRVVRVPGVGHDVSLRSECGRTVLLDFLQQPEGGYDASCLDTLAVPPFTTGT